MEPNQALTQFQSINRTRIERLRELAPKSQQNFFDLLALLFHLTQKDSLAILVMIRQQALLIINPII